MDTRENVQKEVWTAADFPAIPDDDLEFSKDEYEAFKRAFLGTEIPNCHLSNEQLERLGCRSWKEYILGNLMANWG